MSHEWVLDGEFFARLLAVDAEVAVRVRAAGCQLCGGPLCVGHYERKPRGGHLAAAGTAEAFTLRYSYCCSRRACRRRTTPPSVRFLGRKVYLEGAILLACTLAPMLQWRASELREAVGIAVRTIRRWAAWWRTVFVASALFTELRARVPGLDADWLPASMVAAFDGRDPIARLEQAARFLRPLTTTTCPGADFREG